MKHNNIRIMGIPEGEESEQGIENIFEEICQFTLISMATIKKDIQEQGLVRTQRN